MAITTNMEDQSQHMQDAQKNVLEYIQKNIIRLDLPFVLTDRKILTIGMPYMVLEGRHTTAVRLIKVWDQDNVVFLKIRELKSERTYDLSWNMIYTGDLWLWSIADFQKLMEIG
jgi:hypothetical protein